MKKFLCLLALGLCCSGCTSLGSFEQSDLNLDQVSKQIDAHIEDGEWQMSVLLDDLEDGQVSEIYGIDSSFVEESLVRRALLPITCDEIAIFHVKEGQMEEVKTALQKYVEQRIEEAQLLQDQIAILKQAQIIEKGAYVVFVCGAQATNVLQYISSLS